MTENEFKLFCRNNTTIVSKSNMFSIGKIKFPINLNFEKRDQYLYVLWDYSNMPNIEKTRIKIGRSINPSARCQNIISQSGLKYCEPYIFFKIKHNINAELLIHRSFSKYRSIGEWFNISPFEAIEMMNDIGLIDHCFDCFISPKELE